ncbi:hypothetical protein [Paenibacillus silvisoli]|uniref:hypothetical protein n=1 Tax=Paenibacillus silvisoli TaxID=3110539 RepID=UPI002804D1A7|nr:hypothetical protein [Paenibacillus silvisoli]
MAFIELLLQKNVLFSLVCILVCYTIIWRLWKALPASVSILMMLFSTVLAFGLDNTLGVEPFDFYNTNVVPTFTLPDAFTWLLYPAFGFLFTYFYYRFRIGGAAITGYILLWSGLGVAFEALNVYFDVFQYKQWKLTYSFYIYLLVQTLYVIMFNVVRNAFVQSKYAYARSTSRWHAGRKRY